MGITGLIPFLEKASSKVHLKNLQGSTVAVDSYCWLHKGAYACAHQLIRGEETTKYLHYCLQYVDMIISYNIKPILVFDGRHLPAKALTESRRRESRQNSKKRAAELLRLGRTEEAYSHMRRSVDITHDMALQLIKECRRRNVDCIVAPYEADAQMAWLSKVNIAQYIITEDSDLTLFGAQKIIFKLDRTGAGLLIEADKFHLAMGCCKEKYNFEKFRRMCILSGCDYLDSLPGIGLAKACKFILKTEQDDMWLALKKIPQYLNMRQLEVDDEYIENFLKAEATFKYMYIYNPLERKMERLNKLDDVRTDIRYCGNAGTPLESDEQAFHLALGNLNPFTLVKVDVWNPDHSLNTAPIPSKRVKTAKHASIWLTKDKFFNVPQSENQQNNSALIVKKIDFNAKTIDDEINANIEIENAKPAESEVFAMYMSNPKDELTRTKRKRHDSETQISNDDSNFTTKSLESNKNRLNPFIKTIAAEIHISQKICENDSLLKVLSPKKNDKNINENIELSGNVKRKIFQADVKELNVEVKSRLFAVNLNQANKRYSNLLDLSNEIEEIDKISEQKQINQAHLYHSPSPRKCEALNKSKDLSPSLTDSGFVSISSNTNAYVNKEIVDAHETIVLSDNESDISTKFSPNVIGSQTRHIKQSIPRLGLSRKQENVFKSKNKLKPTKLSLDAAKSATQTRLSMFGFQKRPSLK